MTRFTSQKKKKKSNLFSWVTALWKFWHFNLVSKISWKLLKPLLWTLISWYRMITYMPYLILWDKISLNLAHLEGNSHKKIQISQNLQTILRLILWRNNHKSHTVVVFTSFLHNNKDFRLYYWGSSKVIFKKISQNFVKSLLSFAWSHRF